MTENTTTITRYEAKQLYGTSNPDKVREILQQRAQEATDGNIDVMVKAQGALLQITYSS